MNYPNLTFFISICRNGLADGMSRSIMFIATPTKIPSSTPMPKHKTNVANVGIKSFPKHYKIIFYYYIRHIKPIRKIKR